MACFERMAACMRGEISIEELTEAQQSALRFPVYRKACHVLAQPTTAHQRAAIDALPDTIRDAVRKECRRLYNHRHI